MGMEKRLKLKAQYMDKKYIDKLSEEGAKKLLLEIIEKLDELDEEDFFGTEGWRFRLNLED